MNHYIWLIASLFLFLIACQPPVAPDALTPQDTVAEQEPEEGSPSADTLATYPFEHWKGVFEGQLAFLDKAYKYSSTPDDQAGVWFWETRKREVPARFQVTIEYDYDLLIASQIVATEDTTEPYSLTLMANDEFDFKDLEHTDLAAELEMTRWYQTHEFLVEEGLPENAEGLGCWLMGAKSCCGGDSSWREMCLGPTKEDFSFKWGNFDKRVGEFNRAYEIHFSGVRIE